MFLLSGASVLGAMAALIAFFAEILLSSKRDLRIPLLEQGG